MSDELDKELTEFLGDEEPGSSDSESEPEPKDESESEPEPTTTEPEPQPAPEPEPEPEPVQEPEPEPAVEELTEREKKLLSRIEALTGKSLGVEEAIAETKPPVKAEPKEPPKDAPPEELNFLEGQNLDDLLDDPTKFNALLVKVYNAGKEAAVTVSTEKVLKSIPSLVTQYVGKQAMMTNLVNDFYKKNPDLGGVKKTVAAVANDVAAENPGLTVDQVFEKVAARTREVLGLKARATAPAKGAPKPDIKKPAFADQKGRRAAPSSGLKGLEKEINDLLS